MFASLLSWLGSLSAATGTKACTIWFIDEPKMPRSLLEK
ncbi:MAG: cyclic lactone autoinducer peptide [Bacilli bacterium]|nr:cyclic lactone autoinducer peptide [Bacilli bacterium]MDY5996283.1 cyclic lactone autoinducer peptide [Bacilli bacterium]